MGIGFVAWSPLGQGYLTGTVWPSTKFPNGGYGKGQSFDTVAALSKDATILDGFVIEGKKAAGAKDAVRIANSGKADRFLWYKHRAHPRCAHHHQEQE